MVILDFRMLVESPLEKGNSEKVMSTKNKNENRNGEEGYA